MRQHPHIFVLCMKLNICGGFFTMQPRCLLKHWSECNSVDSGSIPPPDLPRWSAAVQHKVSGRGKRSKSTENLPACNTNAWHKGAEVCVCWSQWLLSQTQHQYVFFWKINHYYVFPNFLFFYLLDMFGKQKGESHGQPFECSHIWWSQAQHCLMIIKVMQTAVCKWDTCYVAVLVMIMYSISYIPKSNVLHSRSRNNFNIFFICINSFLHLFSRNRLTLGFWDIQWFRTKTIIISKHTGSIFIVFLCT